MGSPSSPFVLRMQSLITSFISGIRIRVIVSVQVDGIPCDEEMDDISLTVDSLKSSDSTDKLSLS